METITDKLDRFYSYIKDYKEGAPDTRYKSWEWCHKAFLENKNVDLSKNPQVIELLALHLGFYLASWGMYRGSSYLLQRDYKAHKNAVRIILSDPNSILWDYIPTEDNIETASNLLFKKEKGLYWQIKKSYNGYEESQSNNEDLASETLVTKILMGTFGCVPAFDRFLKDGISVYKKSFNRNKIGEFNLSQKIEQTSGDNFKALSLFSIQNKNNLHIISDFLYPPMKLVDMYFWQVGYEMDIVKSLKDKDVKPEKKNELVKKAKYMGLTVNDDIAQAIIDIENKNIR